MFRRQKIRDGQAIPFAGSGRWLTYKTARKAWHLGGGQGVSRILFMRLEQAVAVVLILNMGALSTHQATAPILRLARHTARLASPSP
jgi:hypothetical protein